MSTSISKQVKQRLAPYLGNFNAEVWLLLGTSTTPVLVRDLLHLSPIGLAQKRAVDLVRRAT